MLIPLPRKIRRGLTRDRPSAKTVSCTVHCLFPGLMHNHDDKQCLFPCHHAYPLPLLKVNDRGVWSTFQCLGVCIAQARPLLSKLSKSSNVLIKLVSCSQNVMTGIIIQHLRYFRKDAVYYHGGMLPILTCVCLCVLSVCLSICCFLPPRACRFQNIGTNEYHKS